MLRETGAVTAIQGDAAKLRTLAPGSAEPQPSSGARRPQLLARCSCSWAAGRVFSTPRQAKGFAHLALKRTWVLRMHPCGCPHPLDLPSADGCKRDPGARAASPEVRG